MDLIGFATNLPKICWPGTGPPDPRSPGSMTSKRYRCWCAAPGKILDTTQHLMKNVRSVFIPLRFFRHIGYFHLNIAGFGHHGSKETQLLNLLSQIVPKWQQLSFCLKCQVSKLRVINFIEFKSIFKCLNPWFPWRFISCVLVANCYWQATAAFLSHLSIVQTLKPNVSEPTFNFLETLAHVWSLRIVPDWQQLPFCLTLQCITKGAASQGAHYQY